jgi:demethylmenaquinone methyltransferase/2-methoxy-6-polyprenyl-1,4-benzoquinol methylase
MRGMFTRIAGRYDRLNRVQSLGLDVLWRRRALAALARVAPSPRRILDLATGTADFAMAAAQRFPGAQVTGVDLTPAMLEVGRRKVEAAGLADRVSLEEGDACALACADASADVAVCAFGFRNFPDRAAALREVARVLAPEGYLLVLELFRPRFRLLAAATAAWMACAARLFAGDAREDYAYLRASVGETCSSAEFGHLATAAGLSAIRRFFFLPACSCLIFRKNMVK